MISLKSGGNGRKGIGMELAQESVEVDFSWSCP